MTPTTRPQPPTRRWSGAEAHHVQVDRLARYLWHAENGSVLDWSRHIDQYRQRAKTILTTPEGWKYV